jgi:antitoxin CcdA
MATKKPVNVSIDADLAATAKAEGLNLSAVLERGLRHEVKILQAERWKRENADAIREANQDLRKNGLWSDELRLF